MGLINRNNFCGGGKKQEEFMTRASEKEEIKVDSWIKGPCKSWTRLSGKGKSYRIGGSGKCERELHAREGSWRLRAAKSHYPGCRGGME
jgi:hypothetical protein